MLYREAIVCRSQCKHGPRGGWGARVAPASEGVKTAAPQHSPFCWCVGPLGAHSSPAVPPCRRISFKRSACSPLISQSASVLTNIQQHTCSTLFFPHFRHAEFYSLYITKVGRSPYEAISPRTSLRIITANNLFVNAAINLREIVPLDILVLCTSHVTSFPALFSKC